MRGNGFQSGLHDLASFWVGEFVMCFQDVAFLPSRVSFSKKKKKSVVTVKQGHAPC